MSGWTRRILDESMDCCRIETVVRADRCAMDGSTHSSFRTDLTEYLMDLLDFVEERIKQAKNDPASRAGALSEASGALPIMKDRLHREDQVVLTQLLLIGFFDEDLSRLADLQEAELVDKMESLYERHSLVRNILHNRMQKLRRLRPRLACTIARDWRSSRYFHLRKCSCSNACRGIVASPKSSA